MSNKRKARHLQFLEESKNYDYNLSNCSKQTLQDKPSKIISRILQIQDARYDESRKQANFYAISMGKEPPNKLSYEKNYNHISDKVENNL